MHAALAFAVEHPTLVKQWSPDPWLVVLAAEDEAELVEYINRATRRGLIISVYREPDLDDAITGIAIQPHPETKRMCSSLPLALKEPAMA